MAQEEIIFKVGVDTGDSANKVGTIEEQFDILKKTISDTEQEVEELTKQFGKNSQEVENARKKLGNLNASFHELKQASINVNSTFAQVYDDLQPLTTRLGEAEDRLYELSLAGKQNTKEYKELLETVARYKQTQIETDRIVDQAALTMTQKLGAAIQGAANGFMVVQGASALFGDESKELEKALLKVQAAMALAQGIEGVRQAIPLFKGFASTVKDNVVGAFTSLTTAELANAQATGTMTTLQKVYTFVVGTSTGAMKAFRIALAATGIGAVVVLLGLAADAMGLFGSSTDETAEKVKKLKEKQQAYKDQLQDELDLLTKLRSERKGGTTELENNIRIMKAKGASDKEVYEAERALIKKQLDDLAFALGYKGSLNLEERNKKRQLLTDLQVLDAEYNRKIKEDREKDNEDALKKAQEKRATLKLQKEKEAQEQLALQRKIEDLTIANIDDANAREIVALKVKHDRELEELQKQYGKKKEFAELEKQLLIQQENEKTALLDEQNKVKSEKEKEAQNKKFEDQKAFIEAELIRAEEDFNLKQQKRIELENKDFEQQMANTELTDGQRELLKAQHEANLVSIAQDSAERQKQIDEATKQSKIELMNAVGSIFGELAGLSKQASAVQKAFAITQVAIDTATAISGLTSISFSPTNGDNIINPLGPYIKLATGTAKIISSMSKVKQILGSGVNVTPPTIGGANANMGTASTQQGTQQTVQAQSTYKVVVVDSDITKMQDKTKKVNAISTI